MSKAVINELIRLKANEDAVKELLKVAEDRLKASHPNKPGTAVLVDGRPHTLKYVWVTYKDGIPELTEHYTRDPEWNAQKKEFDIWSPVSSKDRSIVYLEPLDEDEQDELQRLNERASSGWWGIDSKSEQAELEVRREELLKRCGHVFKHDYMLFSSGWERYTCEKCYLDYNSSDYEN